MCLIPKPIKKSEATDFKRVSHCQIPKKSEGTYLKRVSDSQTPKIQRV